MVIICIFLWFTCKFVIVDLQVTSNLHKKGSLKHSVNKYYQSLTGCPKGLVGDRSVNACTLVWTAKVI